MSEQSKEPNPVPVAGDYDKEIPSYDSSTPMAREIEEQLRRQRAVGEPLPRPSHTRTFVVAN
ncbi:MAG TPA: hypothetical protein PLO27_04420, partial [Marmoricola sp.]|nr:hypothetical protein [Marmoricola sp.]